MRFRYVAFAISVLLVLASASLLTDIFKRSLPVQPRYSPTMYGHHIRTALDTLHAQVPRILVNLVPMMDMSPIPFIKTGPLCSILHW